MPHESPAGTALAVFDLDGTITRHDTFLPFLLACLARSPWRLPRLLLIVPLALGFLFHRDHGRFKGALLHATLGGLRRDWLQARAAAFVSGLLQRNAGEWKTLLRPADRALTC